MANLKNNFTSQQLAHRGRLAGSTVFAGPGVYIGIQAPQLPFSGITNAPIIAQVSDWPFATDVHGHAFDQANLWGISTYCYNDNGFGFTPALDPKFHYFAVPKTLPLGYTWHRRYEATMGSMSYGMPTAYVSAGPVFWRDANGYAPDWPNGYRWLPTNLDDTTNDSSFGPSTAPVSLLTPSGHVGFRDGTATISGPIFGLGFVDFTTTYYLGWDAEDYVVTSTNFPRNIVWSHTIPPLPAPYTPYSIPLNTGAIQGTPDGTIRKYYIWCTGFDSLGNPDNSANSVVTLWLAPRTDIPMHYSASTLDRYAPGGVIP